MMTGMVIFDPLLPWPVLWGAMALATGFVVLALWRGLPGWWLRGPWLWLVIRVIRHCHGLSVHGNHGGIKVLVSCLHGIQGGLCGRGNVVHKSLVWGINGNTVLVIINNGHSAYVVIL